jgi:hypothetical protein
VLHNKTSQFNLGPTCMYWLLIQPDPFVFTLSISGKCISPAVYTSIESKRRQGCLIDFTFGSPFLEFLPGMFSLFYQINSTLALYICITVSFAPNVFLLIVLPWLRFSQPLTWYDIEKPSNSPYPLLLYPYLFVFPFHSTLRTKILSLWCGKHSLEQNLYLFYSRTNFCL